MIKFSCGHNMDNMEWDGEFYTVIEAGFNDVGYPCLHYSSVCKDCYKEMLVKEEVFDIMDEKLAMEYLMRMED